MLLLDKLVTELLMLLLVRVVVAVSVDLVVVADAVVVAVLEDVLLAVLAVSVVEAAVVAAVVVNVPEAAQAWLEEVLAVVEGDVEVDDKSVEEESWEEEALVLRLVEAIAIEVPVCVAVVVAVSGTSGMKEVEVSVCVCVSGGLTSTLGDVVVRSVESVEVSVGVCEVSMDVDVSEVGRFVVVDGVVVWDVVAVEVSVGGTGGATVGEGAQSSTPSPSSSGPSVGFEQVMDVSGVATASTPPPQAQQAVSAVWP